MTYRCDTGILREHRTTTDTATEAAMNDQQLRTMALEARQDAEASLLHADGRLTLDAAIVARLADATIGSLPHPFEAAHSTHSRLRLVCQHCTWAPNDSVHHAAPAARR